MEGNGAAVQVEANPAPKDKTPEEVGLAIPAKDAASEKAWGRWIAETGSRTPSVSSTTEACSKYFYKRARGGKLHVRTDEGLRDNTVPPVSTTSKSKEGGVVARIGWRAHVLESVAAGRKRMQPEAHMYICA